MANGDITSARPRLTSWSSMSSLTSSSTRPPSLTKIGRKPSILDEIDTRQRNDVRSRLRGLLKSTSDASLVTMQLPVIVKSSCQSPLVTNGIKSPISSGSGYRSVLSEINKSEITISNRKTRSLPRGATLDYSSLSNYSSTIFGMTPVSESKEQDDVFAEQIGPLNNPNTKEFKTLKLTTESSLSFTNANKIKFVNNSVENKDLSSRKSYDCTDSVIETAKYLETNFTDEDSTLTLSSKIDDKYHSILDDKYHSTVDDKYRSIIDDKYQSTMEDKYHSRMFLFPPTEDHVEGAKISDDTIQDDNMETVDGSHSVCSSVEASSCHHDLSVSVLSSEAASDEQDTSEDTYYTAKEFENSDDAYESAMEHELIPIFPAPVSIADETETLLQFKSFDGEKEKTDIIVLKKSECEIETPSFIFDCGKSNKEDFEIGESVTGNDSSDAAVGTRITNGVENGDLLINIAENNESVELKVTILYDYDITSHINNTTDMLFQENPESSTVINNLELLSELSNSEVTLGSCHKYSDMEVSNEVLNYSDFVIEKINVTLSENSEQDCVSDASLEQSHKECQEKHKPESDFRQTDIIEIKSTVDTANAFRYSDELLNKLSSMSLLSNEPIAYHPVIATDEPVIVVQTHSFPTQSNPEINTTNHEKDVAKMFELLPSDVKPSVIQGEDDEYLLKHNGAYKAFDSVNPKESSDHVAIDATGQDNMQITNETTLLLETAHSLTGLMLTSYGQQINNNDLNECALSKYPESIESHVQLPECSIQLHESLAQLPEFPAQLPESFAQLPECSVELPIEDINESRKIKFPFKLNNKDAAVERIKETCEESLNEAVQETISNKLAATDKPIQKKVRFLFDEQNHVNSSDSLTDDDEANINNVETSEPPLNSIQNECVNNNVNNSTDILFKLVSNNNSVSSNDSLECTKILPIENGPKGSSSFVADIKSTCDLRCEVEKPIVEVQTILHSRENGITNGHVHYMENTSPNSDESLRKYFEGQNGVDIDFVDLTKNESKKPNEWSTMEVEIEKGVTGLGFCISGGVDSPLGKTPITVKRIFNGNTDAQRILKAGDELLCIGDVEITTSTHQHALQILKSVPKGPIKLRIRRQMSSTE